MDSKAKNWAQHNKDNTNTRMPFLPFNKIHIRNKILVITSQENKIKEDKYPKSSQDKNSTLQSICLQIEIKYILDYAEYYPAYQLNPCHHGY